MSTIPESHLVRSSSSPATHLAPSTVTKTSNISSLHNKSNPNAFKRPHPGSTGNGSMGGQKKSANTSDSGMADTPKSSNQVPVCLKKLVRTIVRTFYSREHSLIVDMLVRNTIMHEDDMCERLRFEKKQLRQYLHTLKTDQFIKSKIQLETDAEGKTTKITHYFIEYQLFVNVVKYRLDQMQRRFESDQRQSTSRASFRCSACRLTYTDLEVDRLINPDNPGQLACVYCRGEVTEQEEDSISRTDARALIAKFHQQIRDPIDAMLRECDAIHLSSSILEPEIKPREPVKDEFDTSNGRQDNSKQDKDKFDLVDGARSLSTPDTHVRIVLTGRSNGSNRANVKQRPIWMADSTINSGPAAGLGELDRGSGTSTGTSTLSSDPNSHAIDSVTQTLTLGRMTNSQKDLSSISDSTSQSAASGASNTGGSGAGGGDIMQLLLVHERRGTTGPSVTRHLQPSSTNRQSSQAKPSGTSSSETTALPTNSPPETPVTQYTVRIGTEDIPYAQITASIVKKMTSQEKSEYIRVGRLVYQSVMLD